MKILFADDDWKIHLIMGLWFQKKSYAFEGARNGQEALEKLDASSFDFLITDVNMPLINGNELVDRVLKRDDAPGMIVVLTSRCDGSQLQEHFGDSRVHIFNKPFSPAALTNVIDQFALENA